LGHATNNFTCRIVPQTALPNVPWQLTGNHWLAIPCIHPADGSIHAIGVVHRGARAAVEFAGGPDFVDGAAPALLKPIVEIDGQPHELSGSAMAWERALEWLPTFTCTIGDVVVRGTVFAPYGRDADLAGAVYAIALESRGAARSIRVRLEGTLGHRQLRVRTARPTDDQSLVSRGSAGHVLLEGSAQPGLAALAVSADDEAEITHEATHFTIARTLSLPAGGRTDVAFYVAAGPERDGAEATVAVLRRRGWRALLAGTRDALQQLEQSTGSEGIDRLINRNLLFAYFYAVARALDDAHYYLVRTRAPWHGAGVTVRDWDALMWTLPAVQLADGALARELQLRMWELHGYAPGRGVHYLDGTLFEPGFSLEGVAAYPIAIDRYARDTGDSAIVDEPVIGDTLYLAHEDLQDRRDRRYSLYSTEVTPGNTPVAHPFTLHANAAVAQALEILRRTLDEETSRSVEDAAAVRAAIKRQFAPEREPKGTLRASIDLVGNASTDDEPSASAVWLPLYEALDRNDSLYRRTVKALPRERGALLREIGRLLGPDAEAELRWLRHAPLHGGVAAELVDDAGVATANAGDASLSGLLAWTAWFAVHALGVAG
jgi:hypothetical protein